jgi:hypothetical protein
MDRTQDTVFADEQPQGAGNDNAPLMDALRGASTKTPRSKAYDLCKEIVWWHQALGSPVTLELVLGPRREHWISAVRGDCIRRVRDTLRWSFPRIGRFFDLDHTTCLHHAKRKGVSRVRATLNVENARHLMKELHDQLVSENPERWASIPGQPKYSISDNGLVRFDLNGNIRRPQLGTNGYTYVTFASGPQGKAVFWPIHRMMAEAFIGPRPQGAQVCHTDGNRLNNRLSNLRYGTAKENAEDRDWHGMTCKGIKNGNAKIKKQGVIDEIRARYAQGGVSQYELADIYGVSQAQINNIILNKQHKAASVNAGAFYTATGGQHHENT